MEKQDYIMGNFIAGVESYIANDHQMPFPHPLNVFPKMGYRKTSNIGAQNLKT